MRDGSADENQNTLWLLENLDRINRAMQATNDLEQVMRVVLDTVFSIFGCDRAWLVYPCDPDAASWRAILEVTGAASPGAFAQRGEQPMDAEVAQVFRAAREAGSVVRFGPGASAPVPKHFAERFGVQSLLGMALYPRAYQPHMLGIHQCSYPRVWTSREERLLHEIGLRLTDALTSLLIFRELQQSETKLEKAQQIAHVGYWERGPEDQLIWSDETYRIYGLQPSEKPLRLAAFEALIHPADRKRVMAAIDAALLGGPRYDEEFRIVRPDGEVRFVRSQGDVAWNQTGQVRRYFGVVQDITDVKRTEESLRDSEEKWKAVFSNNPTMYFMVDETGTILSVNPFGAEHLGFAIDALVGRSVLDIFHPADRDHVQRNARICFDRVGQAMNWEARKIRADSAVMWVRETARAMRMKDNSVLLVACEDITDGKRADYLTRQLLDHSSDYILVVGPDYRIQRANMEAYRNRLGLPPREVVGMHIADVIGTGSFERTTKEQFDRCFAGEETQSGGWVKGQLGRRYIAATYSPLRPDWDHVEAVLVIVRDITEYMQAADSLREAQAELARMNRLTTMGQLTASIAHEVSQPIAATVANAHAALRWLDATPPDLNEARQALHRVVRDGHRGGEILDRIRSLTKKRPSIVNPIDINRTIVEVLALLDNELRSHNVLLRTQLAADLPPVEGDRIQLQQVVLNLVMNAIEAMNSATDGSRNLLIATEQDGCRNVCVSVRDSGPGLKPGEQDRIFDPFYTTKPGGMGMGLSICRSIIEAHGGQVQVAPNEPRGVSLGLTLPVSGTLRQ